MATYGEEVDSDINRFSEDLSLFEVPNPQLYWREVTTRKSDTSASDDFKQKQRVYMASMQQQRSQVQTVRYSPKHMFGGTVQTEHRAAYTSSAVSVREAKPPIPAGLGPASAGGTVANNATSVQGKVGPMSPNHSQMESRGVVIAGTRYPAPRTSNMMQAHSMHHSHQQTIYANLPNANTNSNYSSPRSSLGSGGGDSKNSSPRTSLTNPPPPPPYDQRFGSPRSSIASPRSSIASLESKHSSPRASLTGVLLEKFPSPRGSLAGPQDRAAIQRAIAGLEQDLYSNLSGTGVMPSLTSIGPRTMPLLSNNRFNEPAPPHIYTDPRMRTMPAQAPVSMQSGPMVNSNVSHNGIGPGNIPVHHGGVSVSSSAGSQSPAPPVIPARVPLHPAGQSDAEKKLAALTQQLERDMRLTSPGPASKTSPETPPEPPPPYHGPHELELTASSVSSQQMQPVSSSQSRTPVRLVAPVQGVPAQVPASQSQPQCPGGKGLNWQVTPPRGSGPSEAEKKLAALTQQLEDEMDQVPQGDYFGMAKLYSIIIICQL